MEQVEYISYSMIKSRKWTDGMIRRFLGNPDLLEVNPHYSLGPKIKLYRLERVLEAENSPEFKEAFKMKTETDLRKESVICLLFKIPIDNHKLTIFPVEMSGTVHLVNSEKEIRPHFLGYNLID